VIPDELLRDVLEFAHATLQVLDRKREGAAIPKQAQPLLRFKKLDRVGLATMRRVLEEHDEIRRAVSEGVQHDVSEGSGRPVDPVALLWLTRPSGWEAEIERLLAEHAEQKRQERLALEERAAEKRLAGAERRLERVRADVARLERDVAEERARRQEVEQQLRTAEASRRSLEQQLNEARAETRRAKQAAETAQSAASDARLALDAESDARSAAVAERDALAGRLEDALRARVEAEEQSRPVGRPAPVDDGAIADAARLLRAAASSLAQAAEAVSVVGDRSTTPSGFAPAALDRDRRSGGDRASGSTPRPVRKPIAIPGGRYGDDVEVASYLLAVPDVQVIVDGYNVAMTGWPQMDLETQRERLVAASEDLVRRVGTRVRIVFDGADVPGWSTVRRLVSIQFSSSGTIADDVIRSLVASAPADRHVVVVTNDKDLVASVRAMGANTIGSQQYLAAVGR